MNSTNNLVFGGPLAEVCEEALARAGRNASAIIQPAAWAQGETVTVRAQVPAPRDLDRQLCGSLVRDIDSVEDDPIFRALEKRKPKQYPYLWLVPVGRPLITFFDDFPDIGYLDLYTKRTLAIEGRQTLCKRTKCRETDVEIRSTTFLDALGLARELHPPITLLSDLGTCYEIGGVLISGERMVRKFGL